MKLVLTLIGGVAGAMALVMLIYGICMYGITREQKPRAFLDAQADEYQEARIPYLLRYPVHGAIILELVCVTCYWISEHAL